MSAQLIQSLIPLLPRYAEEEGDFYSVSRDDLIAALSKQHQIENEIATYTVAFVENLLDTLAVLNPDYLLKGEWCFISFPAQLMATSILTVLGDRESQFFEPNFWNTQSISNNKKDRQRDVLRLFENARSDNHRNKNAQPIRYIYVSWGIIKLDNKILFFQREDTKKRFDITAGDYGLLGGRANQTDVNIPYKEALLKVLQSPDSAIVKNALQETLKRELREEAELVFEDHYTFKPWRGLRPYRQIQGSAPNHALTEYYLEIFQVELTLEGYLFLQEKIKFDGRLVWFSLDEIQKGQTADGKFPYIKALVDHFTGKHDELVLELRKLPDSFSNRYVIEKNKYGITLPLGIHEPILAGVLGKEKPLGVMLTQRQLGLLLGLAAHLRGFNFKGVEQGVAFHPFGWVQISENQSLQSELINLSGLLKSTDIIIENQRDTLFRLSVNPELIFFDEKLFSFSVRQADLDSVSTKIPVSVRRAEFDTAFGKIKEKSEEFKLTLEFAANLRSLDENQFIADNDDAQKIEDNYKKGLHKEPKFLALGLRGLVRRDAGMIRFVVRYEINKNRT
ncbi:NUDIX hydrolase [Methyloglobulus sp.]|uniref:NUDIX hydrolase n=1 Tax=Methyloglobulus sp. TaxID=2518622 RepID=UPI0032B7FF85